MMPNVLKQWRKRTGYSQSELAKVLDVIPLTVSRWERGVREIPSFLHLALECIEKKGGEQKKQGTTKTKKERRY